MKVYILAGGLGTRIRQLFPDQPKGMIRFGEQPFLERQMKLLAGQGFLHFVLCVGYKCEQIIEYFGDGSDLGLKITFSVEGTPRGTAGALRVAAQYFEEVSVVLNGDTYAPIDYRALVSFHAAHRNAIATVAVACVSDAGRFGRVVLDDTDRIIAFHEKSCVPSPGMVSAGIYVLDPRVLSYISPDLAVSLEADVFPRLLAAEERIYGYRMTGAFVDVGTPEGYRQLDILPGHPKSGGGSCCRRNPRAKRAAFLTTRVAP